MVFAQGLKTLSAKRAWVVHGRNGLDAISPEGETLVSEVMARPWYACCYGSSRWKMQLLRIDCVASSISITLRIHHPS